MDKNKLHKIIISELQEIIIMNKLKGSFIIEQSDDKITVLLDGTSSAGKSYTSGLLNAVDFTKAKNRNQWVIIGSDHFTGEGNEGERNRLKLDPPSIRDWAKGNEWGIVSGIYRDKGEDVPPNPKENEYIKGTDPRAWYMAEEYKTGGWKKVIFDDIGKSVSKYIPNIKYHILLHAPLYILLQNVSERNRKGGAEHRDPKGVLKQYLEKFETTKQKPNESYGDPSTILTRKGLKSLLSKHLNNEKTINDFINRLGVLDDDNYYIKVKDNYLTDETQLINVDQERVGYLEKFNNIVKQ